MLLTAIQTGLRASELTGLNCGDLHLAAGPHLSCRGKGRKQRITPLTQITVAVLRVWLSERNGQPDQPLFPTSRGRRLSRDGLERRITKHVGATAHRCPSLHEKTITPHTLRHTAAMQLQHTRSTPPSSSPSGSVTNGSKRPRCTSTPTSRSNGKPSARTEPLDAKPGRYQPPETRSLLPRSALIMPTPTGPIRPLPQHFTPDVGITRTSA